MAAARSLWDDNVVTGRGGVAEAQSCDTAVASAGASPSPRSVSALPLLPMLQPTDEPRLEQRPHRFLAMNELDGPDYDDAIDCADAAAGERDAVLYGTTENVRVGWTKDAAA